jgi:hypothetical protein
MSRTERTRTRSRRAHCAWLLATVLLTSSGASAQEDRKARIREPALEGPFPARITRVIEGDHFEIDFDFGPIIRGQQRLRLANANTPSPFSDRECEARLGLEVVGLVRELVRPQQLWVRDFRLGRNSFERVGRVLVSNKMHRLEQVDLGEYLIVLGLALPYDDSRWNPDRRVWVCDETSESR